MYLHKVLVSSRVKQRWYLKVLLSGWKISCAEILNEHNNNNSKVPLRYGDQYNSDSMLIFISPVGYIHVHVEGISCGNHVLL